MTLIHRLLRRLGYDVTKRIEHDETRYKYTVVHLNGEVTTHTANDHYHDEGFLILVDVPSVHVSALGFGVLTPPWKLKSWDVVSRVEGVQEYERTEIGVDTWSATWSKADGSLTNISVECGENDEN